MLSINNLSDGSKVNVYKMPLIVLAGNIMEVFKLKPNSAFAIFENDFVLLGT